MLAEPCLFQLLTLWPELTPATDVISSSWFSELSFSSHHSFYKYSLRFYYALDTGNSVMKKTNTAVIFMKFYNLNGTDHKIIFQIINAKVLIVINTTGKRV
jgi:hypothetical protein